MSILRMCALALGYDEGDVEGVTRPGGDRRFHDGVEVPLVLVERVHVLEGSLEVSHVVVLTGGYPACPSKKGIGNRSATGKTDLAERSEGALENVDRYPEMTSVVHHLTGAAQNTGVGVSVSVVVILDPAGIEGELVLLELAASPEAVLARLHLSPEVAVGEGHVAVEDDLAHPDVGSAVAGEDDVPSAL